MSRNKKINLITIAIVCVGSLFVSSLIFFPVVTAVSIEIARFGSYAFVGIMIVVLIRWAVSGFFAEESDEDGWR